MEAPKSKKPTVTFTNETQVIPPPPQQQSNNGVARLNPELKQENPQEPNSPPNTPMTLPILEHGEEQPRPRTRNNKTKRKDWKRRKRGRQVRVASVAEEVTESELLPSTHYEAVLRRRAIRKLGEDIMKPPAPSPTRRGLFGSPRVAERKVVTDVVVGYDEEVGDTSLGMKLNIMGGRVIVQAVNALGDSRASPAQLTGLVKRGDVLLEIDGNSIVNLPLDQLVIGLNPLSTPESGGAYKRSVKVLFAAGEGLELLKKNDEKAAKSAAAPDVFSLTQFLPNDFQVADQLSGAPMFEDTPASPQHHKTLEPVVATPLRFGSFQEEKSAMDLHAQRTLTMNELISLGIADLLKNEKQRFNSEFFAWNEDFSELLRPSIVVTVKSGDDEINAFLNKKELIERGEEAMKGAQKLAGSMEDIDKGIDLRSFKSWSSNASLRSRASTRRRYIMDASIIGSTIAEEAPSDVGVSVASDELDEMDGLNGDELLAQLAAQDEIWRRQVLETIENATKEMEEDGRKAEEEAEAPVNHEVDITEKLGSLFLGEQVNKLLTKKKKSYALPPDDVTCVMFDLVTHLACSTPDEISVKGKFEINPQTSLVPFQRSKNSSVDKDTLLATLFVVNDVFPAWLKSFKALPWEERRVLWPFTKATTTHESISGGSLADDLLTIDSPGAPASPVLRKKKKNLRETIEDMELDIESRAEACYLVTFYFTQEILPGMNANGAGWRNKNSFTEQDALDFVDTYGAYLKLPMSVAYAAFLKSESVVARLLALAKHDPRHCEALKDIARPNAIVLYEPTMLSAITKCVLNIKEQKLEGRSHLIHLSVSAFPDLRPWLVRQGCIGDGENDDEDLEEIFYVYLSLLLHPLDGHDAARQDRGLVKEWCERSLKGDGKDDAYRRSRRANFLAVASRKQSEYKAYNRDLPFLMELAAKSDEVSLALELLDEMIEHKRYVLNEEIMSRVLFHLRSIASGALADRSTSKPMHSTRLKKAFRLFQKISSAQTTYGVKDGISVSAEFDDLISSINDDDRAKFLVLLASEAEPVYALQSLHSWSQVNTSSADVLPVLHLCLQRSVRLRNRKELSPALLRVEKARSSTQTDEMAVGDEAENTPPGKGMLWRLMMRGDLQIDK